MNVVLEFSREREYLCHREREGKRVALTERACVLSIDFVTVKIELMFS